MSHIHEDKDFVIPVALLECKDMFIWVCGDFVVVITNQNYEANDTQTSNASDTMFVIDVDWTGYSE